MAGFEEYATRIRKMFSGADPALTDLMEGLFHIAVADGQYHPKEDDFLCRVSRIFELPDATFRALRARFVPDAEQDPYDILGVSRDMDMSEIRAPGANRFAKPTPMS